MNPSILAAHLRPFARAVEARGGDATAALLRADLPAGVLQDAFARLPLARFAKFVAVCEALTADPQLGLHAGELARIEDFDILGMLARCGPNVGSVWDYFTQHTPARERDFELALRGRNTVLRQLNPAGFALPRTISEYFLTTAVVLGSRFIGPLEPHELRLMHPRPSDTREHERIFRARLYFGCSENALVFAGDFLAKPMQHADAALWKVLGSHAKRTLISLNADDNDLPQRVRQLLTEELHTGQATVRQLAARLHRSERTLRRQLRQHGTSYQEMLDELRRKLALQHVQERERSVAETASLLGFCETGAFYRAFKRWTGMSASEYRSRHSDERTARQA